MVRILGRKHAPSDPTGDVPAVVKAERTRPDVLGGVNAKAKKRQALILGVGGLVMVGAAGAYILPGSGNGSKRLCQNGFATVDDRVPM